VNEPKDWCKSTDDGLPEPDLIIYMDIKPQVAVNRKGYGEERYEKVDTFTEIMLLFLLNEYQNLLLTIILNNAVLLWGDGMVSELSSTDQEIKDTMDDLPFTVSNKYYHQLVLHWLKTDSIMQQ
jgi:hypothetical protein